MPHPLTTNKAWEGGDADSMNTKRLFSTGDFQPPRTPTHAEDEVNYEPSALKLNHLPSSRVERLLRERRLRRSGSCFNLGEELEGKTEVTANYGAANASNGRVVDFGAGQPSAGGGLWLDGHESSGNEKCHRATQRLLVVANRLPVSAIRNGNKWSLELSAGGLVSALLGVKQNFETRWIGWAGVNVQDEEGQISLSSALAENGCVPVFLDVETVAQYYNGYCNNVLWPLFHYIGLPQEDRLAATRSLQSQFGAYKRANKMFADVVFSQYQEGDVVWCHDYHLMFLPKWLKELNSHMKVGWFLHTPFPSSEIYRTLPLRSELLKAVLTADLIGFHTYDYARHFVSACTRILGVEGTPEGVEDQGKLTRVAAFPIGIDPERFIQALETEVVKSHIQELQACFAGRKEVKVTDSPHLGDGILLALDIAQEIWSLLRGVVLYTYGYLGMLLCRTRFSKCLSSKQDILAKELSRGRSHFLGKVFRG